MFNPVASAVSAWMRPSHGWLRSACTLFVLFTMGVSAVHADSQIKVLDTYPAGNEVTLTRNQNFYVHLHYTTDRPIRIWVWPYFHGKPAHAGTNGSLTYTSSGEALGWFFMASNQGEVDEIRVETDERTPYGSAVLTYPVHITGSELDRPSEPQPEWVTRLKAREDEQQRQAYETYMHQPVSFGTSLLFRLFMVAMLALGLCGFALPIVAWARWRGVWRMAATVPLALMGFVLLRLIIGVQRDPTSHNLWPFEIMMAGGLSLIVLGVLKSMRRAFGAPGSSG